MLIISLILWIYKCTSERSDLSGLSPAQCTYRRNALHAGGLVRSSHTRVSVCGWPAALVCEALRHRVMEEEGQEFSLSYDTESAVASMFKQVGQPGLARTVDHCALSLCGSVWKRISLLLTTDDVDRPGLLGTPSGC